jgi:exonuclease VII large subunit
MTALWILQAYVVLGAVSAIIILMRRGGGAFRARIDQALLALVLWPFVLPVALAPGQAAGCTVTKVRSERARRLDEVAGRLEECWRHASAESAWAADQGREHQVLDRFILRLRSQQRRIEEMEVALAAAPESVKERLSRLHEHAVAELEHSISLVEDLAAQLTLLRFSDLGNPSAARVERSHIEELLLRIEALAEASQPVGAEASPTVGTVARA